ncbi:DinB family protein [Hanstruepera ponticola]|uniref:DinB family protein n=1 Tax=Hanstruepera ponticola TaxID=2042995 RepID=UPI00177AC16E|nr:DinB family protein [Hanstruepera ponticola]
MESAQKLASRFREVILNGTWIANTNYQDQLSNITWQQAITKVSSLNTIALLAFHINYYIAGVMNVFKGGNLEIHDKYSFDMPEITSENEWNKLLKTMMQNAEAFAKYVEEMSEEQLDNTFVDPKYGSYRRNIEALIEHSYYHLGQVSLIRKMIESKNKGNTISA